MWNDDAKVLADAIARDFGGRPAPYIPVATKVPALRVIDCVLSLRRSYDKVVVPRVDAFGELHPDIRTCADLRAAIDRVKPRGEFVRRELRINSPRLEGVLVGVLDYLIGIQNRFEGDTELERLKAWALWARPGDYLSMGMRGFALAGFQYLRMVFGADTTKPDVHVVAYVSKALDRSVTPVQALYILEAAAGRRSIPLRHLDAWIWTAGARRKRQ
jgi:hypothetical protein